MHQIYLARMAEPHSSISETQQLMSTFITTYFPQEYESRMVASQKVYNATRKLLDQRDRKEDRVKRLRNTVAAFQEYLAWELEVKKPHVQLVNALYKRALAQHPTDAAVWEECITFSVSAHDGKKWRAEMGLRRNLHIAKPLGEVKAQTVIRSV